MTLNMPADILRGLTRDDASARMTHPAPDIDIPAAEDAVRPLLVALGQDPEAEHLRQTPRRVAAAFSEPLTPSDFELTAFANEQGYDQLVLTRDIPFRSLCQHQVLPFYGVAHVGYLPAGRIAALPARSRR